MKRRTYRYFTGQPLYTFGYGLSYTSFSYSRLHVPPTVHAGDNVTVEADLRNNGNLRRRRGRRALPHPAARLPDARPQARRLPARSPRARRLNASLAHHRPPLPQPGRRQGQPHHPPRRLHPLPRQHPARHRRDHAHRPLHRYRSARTPQITALHTRSEDIYIDINTSHLERRSELHKERAALSSRPQ